MVLLAALGLLGARAFQADTWTIFGNPVTAIAPEKAVTAYPDDVAQWSGWGNLKGPASPSFWGAGDWGPMVNAPALQPDAAKWQVKIVLLPSIAKLYGSWHGNSQQVRYVISQPEKSRIAQGLALAAATIQAQSGGHVGVAYTTEEEGSLYPEESVNPGSSLVQYLTPRLNGGSFEANDKRYRGPFNLCLVIRADDWNGQEAPSKIFPLNGTSVGVLSAPVDDQSTSMFALRVLEKFEGAGEVWAARHGLSFTGEFPHVAINATPNGVPASLFGNAPADIWASLVSTWPVAGTEWQAGKAKLAVTRTNWGQPVLVPSVESSNATVTVNGDVLNLKLSGEFPNGGMALPDIIAQAPKEKFLVFKMRTKSPDVVAIGGVVDGRLDNLSTALGARSYAGNMVPVPADGQWHTVAISIGQLHSRANHLGIGVLPFDSLLPKLSIVESSYDFSGFTLADAAPDDAIPASESKPAAWELRAEPVRHGENGQQEVPFDALVTALADPDDNVKLSACQTLRRYKAPGIEEKLVAVVGNLNPTLTDSALAALAFQDSAAARADLQSLTRTGPGTHAKAKAAFYLSQLKDGGSVGLISGLEGTARDWRDRLDALMALAQRGGPEANLFLRSFLTDSDPQVRLTAVQDLPLDDADGMKQVLFISVNDPYDVVRAAACEKLLQSADPNLKKEGYRGTVDDSWYTGVLVLDWITEHPSATDRPALRQAILSPYGEVRAATLNAFAASADSVVSDEIANVLSDADPRVQLALLRLAKAKKLALPAETVTLLKASASAAVVQAANNLGE